MATSALDIGPIKLAVTETVILTVAASHDYNVNAVRFLNSDSSIRTITIYEYKPPQTASDVEALVAKNFALNPGEVFEYGPVVLSATRKLSALADVADKVTVHVSGWDHS